MPAQANLRTPQGAAGAMEDSLGDTLLRIERFIKGRLRDRLERDLHKLRIVKEADLEVCAYYHMRRYLRLPKRWRVLARRYAPGTGRYHDLLIFERVRPRIALELKWNREEIPRKDLKSLRKALATLKVRKAYFITTVIPPREYRRVTKGQSDKYRLHEVLVKLRLKGRKLRDWKERRETLRMRT